MERQPISVSMLAGYIKQIFDAETLLYNIDVIGEISSFGVSGNNAFFVIKDENAMLNCVLFGVESYIPKIGEKVIVTGTPKYYVKGGKLNFNAVSIKPFGEGELYKRFLELKNKLQAEGLFDLEHKKPMPKKIDRIGVVTSETGAVIHDIINVVSRRNSAQDIVLYPIKVQGLGADVDIVKGIEFFSNYDNIDAIIVGRGGGSDEDLQSFNSENVVRAIYNCKKFVVSAVGHETDFTLCDYVADLRAPTPSAAAELLTKDRVDRKMQLDLLMQNISSAMQNKVLLKNTNLITLYDKLQGIIQNYVEKKTNEISMIYQKIQDINPTKILSSGYARIERDGEVINKSNLLNLSDKVKIYFADGEVMAEIIEKKK